MSTPSSPSDGGSPKPDGTRDLRDRWQFRVVAIVAVLALGLLVSKGCGSAGRNITDDEAVALAKQHATFEPDKYLVRFVQQGIPPQPFWGVSLYDVGPQGQTTRYEVFLVNATTGEVKLSSAG